MPVKDAIGDLGPFATCCPPPNHWRLEAFPRPIPAFDDPGSAKRNASQHPEPGDHEHKCQIDCCEEERKPEHDEQDHADDDSDRYHRGPKGVTNDREVEVVEPP